MTRATPWSVPIAVHEVPPAGRHVVLSADAATRAAIASALDVRALPRLEAQFDLDRRGRDSLHVAGTVSATVGQTCVVTLEPIDNVIDEPVDLVFVAGGADAGTEVAGGGANSEDFASADPPEPLRNGVVDLGAIAVEFLTLAIDPYPRKPDAEFVGPADDEQAHPFAALAALKRKPDDR